MELNVIRFISAVHDEGKIIASSKGMEDFLKSGYDVKYTEPGTAPKGVTIVWIMTGGTEMAFKKAYDAGKIRKPVILLASDINNSLPASLEIMSYIKSKGDVGYLVHGSEETMRKQIGRFVKFEETLQAIRNSKMASVGKPSDWLVASGVDYEKARSGWGTNFVDIPLEELYGFIDSTAGGDYDGYFDEALDVVEPSKTDISGAHKIYLGLNALVGKNSLDGFTLRCFDLLSRYKNTGCIALSRLNDEGITAGCEGDMPSAFTMYVIEKLTGDRSFMSNPSKIDAERNSVIFAHCTVPTSMTDSFVLRSHFESGIGVGIAGHIPEGRVTVFKIGGEGLDRYFLSGGEILGNLKSEDRCRTQIEVKMDEDVESLMKNPIGNHHVIVEGDHRELIEDFMNYAGF